MNRDKDHNNNEVLLAVSRLCIAWYIDGILEEKFSIDRIRRWMAIPEKQLFQMEIDRGYSELYVLGTGLKLISTFYRTDDIRTQHETWKD